MSCVILRPSFHKTTFFTLLGIYIVSESSASLCPAQDIAGNICKHLTSLNTLIYMKSKRGLVWPTWRSTCFVWRKIDQTISYLEYICLVSSPLRDHGLPSFGLLIVYTLTNVLRLLHIVHIVVMLFFYHSSYWRRL